MPAIRLIFERLSGNRVCADFKETLPGLIGLLPNAEQQCLNEQECFDLYKKALANKDNLNDGQPSEESADDLLRAFREIRAYKKSKGISYDVVGTFSFERN